MTLREDRARENAREREKIKANLKMLRDAGVLLKFWAPGEEKQKCNERPIRIAHYGTNFYIAPKADETGMDFNPYFNASCRRQGGLAIRIASWESPAFITLDMTTFHFYRTLKDYRADASLPHERNEKVFDAKYIRQLNSRC